MIKFSFSIEHVQYVHHTMIEASADLSGTELELSDVTSPLLASRVITSEEEQGSSRKKKIKPTKSINNLFNFESESWSDAEGEEMFLPDSDPDPQPEKVVYTLPTWRRCTPASRRRWTVAVARSLEEIGHIRWVSDASVTITECWDNFYRRAHVKAYIETLP